jgi:hypothetical protein
MMLFELLLEKLSDTLLFEMAFSRKSARDQVSALSPEIFEHLVKLFVFQAPEYKKHWITEINAWLTQINRIYLKPSKKKPSWQTLYRWLVFDSAPHYDARYIDGLVNIWRENQYSDLVLHDYDSELVLNQILIILEKACQDIAEPNKFVSVNRYLNL